MTDRRLGMGSRFDLIIRRLDHRGHGEAEVEGDPRPVRVPASAPGDQGRVEIVHASPRRLVGRWIRREPGPQHHRETCPHRPDCGGCVAWEVRPEALWQAKWGRAQARLGHLGEHLQPGLGASPRGPWRTRHRLFVDRRSGSVRFVVPTPGQGPSLAIDQCPILPPTLRHRLDLLREQLEAAPLASVVSIVLTLGTKGISGLARVGIGLRALDKLPDLRPPVGEAGDAVSWLMADDSERNHFGGTVPPVSYTGPECVGVQVGEVVIPTPPFAFVQVHPTGREELLKAVMRWIPTEPGFAIDAGCGTGIFARSLARRGWRVLAIDDGAALEPAWRHPVERVTFRQEGAGAAPWPLAPALVVCDPPRSGLDAQWSDRLLAARPDRIILIHCGLEAARRDLHLLDENGYRCLAIDPIDLMPGTMQVELVSVWKRNHEEDCGSDGRG